MDLLEEYIKNKEKINLSILTEDTKEKIKTIEDCNFFILFSLFLFAFFIFSFSYDLLTIKFLTGTFDWDLFFAFDRMKFVINHANWFCGYVFINFFALFFLVIRFLIHEIKASGEDYSMRISDYINIASVVLVVNGVKMINSIALIGCITLLFLIVFQYYIKIKRMKSINKKSNMSIKELQKVKDKNKILIKHIANDNEALVILSKIDTKSKNYKILEELRSEILDIKFNKLDENDKISILISNTNPNIITND